MGWQGFGLWTRECTACAGRGCCSSPIAGEVPTFEAEAPKVDRISTDGQAGLTCASVPCPRGDDGLDAEAACSLEDARSEANGCSRFSRFPRGEDGFDAEAPCEVDGEISEAATTRPLPSSPTKQSLEAASAAGLTPQSGSGGEASPCAEVESGDDESSVGSPAQDAVLRAPSQLQRTMTCTDDSELPLLLPGSEPLSLNVYFIRSVAFDENGRVQRTAKSNLTWGRKLVKDVLGIYHVGLEIHGVEYTFGNYHAKNSRRLGSWESGVCAHAPRGAGPRYVFKDSINLGSTLWAAPLVEEAAAKLGSDEFTAGSYDKIQHNCVDFVRSLGNVVGASELPLWCHRAASVARLPKAGVDAVGAAVSAGFESVSELPKAGVDAVGAAVTAGLGNVSERLSTSLGAIGAAAVVSQNGVPGCQPQVEEDIEANDDFVERRYIV